MVITKAKNNQFEKCEMVKGLEVLKEFKDMFIGHLRYEKSNLNGYKILYDLDDIERMVENLFQAIIKINEYEHPYFDEEDIPI